MDETTREEAIKKEKNTGMAILAYIIFFLPLLTEAKNDPFVKYHVKQGLVLFLTALAAWIVGFIPYVGWYLVWPLNIVVLVFFVMGIMNVLNGEEKPLPVIGEFAKKFKI